jgi:processive 1,2-diacylglycerol beta-glucosyltransferase
VLVSWVLPSKSSVPIAIISADVIIYSIPSERLYPYGKMIRRNVILVKYSKIMRCEYKMTRKKIQIFYASIGSGHLVAARSIYQAIKNIAPDVEVELRDIFKQSTINVFFQEVMAFLPSFVFPALYTKIWRNGSFKWLYKISCSFGPTKRNILNHIQSFSPDLIICTHTYPCTVISNWKKDRSVPILIAVATDQFIHPYWAIKNINAFIAPNNQMIEELIKRGLEIEKIFSFGIPVSPELIKSSEKAKSGKMIKVIILAGSYKVAPYLIIHKRVKELIDYLENRQSEKILWQFVFGAANDLSSEAKRRFVDRKDVEVYDFPEKFQDMLAQTDFVFTKPGGLIVAEALALKKPVILLSAGAGQERENSNFVINSGSGTLLKDKEDLFGFLEELINNPRSVQKRFIQPSISLIKSAQHVADLALRLMDES